ncbi:MAG TPA: type II secretion system protein GspG [bacterium]|nr:type II secretion system protein GspG [bacterium]
MLFLAVREERSGKRQKALRMAGCALLLLCCGFWCMSIVAVRLVNQLKCSAASGDIGAIRSAMEIYQQDVVSHKCPGTLAQLVKDDTDGWSGPYMATITADPWDNRYCYTSDGSNYTIMSIHEVRYGSSETIRYILATDSMELITQ